MYDVIIVGGGPAGLSAALVLGRCRRKVLLCDEGKPRNAVARGVHGYLSRDGIPPARFRRLCHGELARYPSVEIRKTCVRRAQAVGGNFRVFLADGRQATSRKLLLATGVRDQLPPLEGIEPLYGHSVFMCPYCDGWECRDEPLAVYGQGTKGVQLALSLKTWSEDVVLCTDGARRLPSRTRDRLKRNGIGLREEKIIRLSGRGRKLRHLVFEDGSRLPRKALFFSMPSYLSSDLMKMLQCKFSQTAGVDTGRYEDTCVPGLYAAGNIVRDVQLVIVAAAEGAKAAFGINTALTREAER